MKKPSKKGKKEHDKSLDNHGLVFKPAFITSVFNSIGTGICVTDERGLFVDVNNAYCKLYGYTREKLIGQSFTLVVPPDFRNQLQKWHDAFFAEGKEPPAEFEVVNKRGDILLIKVTAELLHLPDGRMFKVTMVEDITEQTKLKRDRDKMLHSLKERIKEQQCLGSIIRLSQQDLTISALLEKAVHLIPSGWQYPDITTASISYDGAVYTTSGHKKSRCLQSISQQTTNKKELAISVCYQKAMPNEDDGPFLTEERYLLQSIVDNLILQINQIIARQAVNQSREELRQLLDYSLDVICTIDQQGAFVKVNAASMHLWGYTPDELVGKQFIDLVHPDDKYKTSEIDEAIKAGKEVTNFENRYIRKDGSVVPIVWSAHRSPHDQLIHCVARDATERIKAASEMSLLINNTEEAFILMDKELRILSFNEQFRHLYKHYFGIEIRKGEHIINYAYSDRRDYLRLLYKRVLQGEDMESELSVPISETEGRVILIKYKPARDSFGQIIGAFVTAIDITERKWAEQQLHLSEKRYRTLVENGADAVAILGADGSASYVSPSITRVLGYTEKEALELNLFDLLHPEDAPAVMARMQSVIENPGVPMQGVTSRTRHKDGSWRWLEATITNMLHDPDINGIVDNFRDVTERIEADNKLRESEAYLLEAQRLAKMGSWNFDFRKDLLTWTDALYDVFGVDRETFLETHDSFVALVDPDYQELVKKTSAHSQQTGDNFNIIYQITTPAGERRIIEEFGYGEKDEKGKVVRLFGTAQDVTEREMTKALQARENELMEASIKQMDTIEKPLEQYLLALEKLFPFIKASVLRVEKGRVWNLTSPSLPTGFISAIEGEPIGPAAGACGTAAFTGERIITTDISQDPIWRGYAKIALKFGLHACWSQPIFDSEKHVIATFANYRAAPGEPSVQEMDIFTRSASLLSVVLESHKSSVELRASNERYDFINKATNDAIYDWDLANDVFSWGEGFKSVFGHDTSANVFRLKDWARLMHPEDDKVNQSLWEDFVASKNANRWHKEFRFRRADGSYAYAEEIGNMIRDRQGRPVRMIGVLRDISAEKVLQLQKQLQAEIGQCFNQGERLKKSLDLVLSTVTRFGNFSGAEIWLVNSEKNKLNKVDAFAASPAMEAFFVETKRITHFDKNEGLPGLVWQTGRMEVLEMDEIDSGFKRSKAARKAGIIAVLGIPLFHNERVVGVLLLSSTERLKGDANKMHMYAPISQFLGAEIVRKAQEEEMQMLFESAPDIMAITAPTGYFVKVNPAFSRIMGFTEEELLHTPLSDLIHPEDLARSNAEYNDAMSGKKRTQDFINRYRTKWGTYRWVSWSASAIFNEEGHVFAFGRDITDRKELEELLQRSSRLAQVGSWEIDVVSKTVFWSDIVKEIREADPDFEPTLEIGMSYFKEGHDQETMRKCVDDCIKYGIQWDEQVQIYTFKGNLKWIRTIGEAEFVNGKCVRVYGSFQDIHTQKMAELALSRKTEYLSTIAAVIGILLQKENWESALADCFALVGEVVGADRVYYFETYTHALTGEPMATQKLEWNKGTAPSQLDNPILIELPLQAFPDFYEPLRNGAHFMAITGLLPEGDLRQAMEDQQIKSTLTIPLFVNESFFGFIGFDDCTREHHWTDDERSFLHTITANLIAAIQRRNSQMELRRIFNERNEILESIGDAFFAVDRKWVVTYWNKQAEVVLGKPKNEVLGNGLWDVYPDAADLKFFTEYHRAMEQGETVHFEAYYPATHQWLEVSAYPSESGLSVYFKDVSIRKLAEEQIRESNERFEKVAQATQDAIWDWDILRDTLYWGSGFQTLFGYPIAKDIPTVELWHSRVHVDDVAFVQDSLRRVLETRDRTNWQCEYRYRKTDRTYSFVIDRGIVIRNAQGVPVRMVGAVSDITHRFEYEESLRTLNVTLDKRAKQLADSNAELEQFAYVASHDLQEPLRMVAGFLTQLELKYSSIVDDKGRQYIRFAVEGAKRMRQIILDLLEFSRAGKMQGDLAEIPLKELLDEVCLLQRELIDEKGARIVYGKLPTVRAYSSPLVQILQNLLGNALKYTRPDVAPQIEISVKSTKTAWEIAVKDNGIGIEKDYFDRIFIIFQRLHLKDAYGGSGMGLAIVKKLVEGMGGRIWVESEVGVGSTFYFTLPK